MILFIKCCVVSVLLLIGFNVHANNAMKQDNQHIRVWNTFVEDIYQLHLSQIQQSEDNLRTEEEIGGYPGNEEFFNETRYYNTVSGKLLSRIQREVKNNRNIHLIEVFVHDDRDRVKLDYLAAYLPEFRNAPIQTLINIHHYNDKLHAFRQFDASGARIYEQCNGSLFNDKVFISLDEDEMNNLNGVMPTEGESNEYLSCFEFIPKIADKYLQPQSFKKQITAVVPDDEYNKELHILSQQINSDANNSVAYIKRGDVYFKLHEFEKAVEDYTKAISLNDNSDEAYFGRGMALGRQGLVQQGINDLSVYIKRHPFNSRAYTKRGVRYIWLGNMAEAKKDMIEAIQLDIRNAEAHDDLGVIYASENNFDKAVYHFKQSIYYDSSYQKAYHNLAMAYVVTERFPEALIQIDKGLVLHSNNRNSLLLKSTILDKLGKKEQAKRVRDHAEFLPDGNWSEQFSMN